MRPVTHFELPANDPERAEKFYKEVFGWGVQKDENMPYWILRTVECDDKMMPVKPGAINGGMYKREEENDHPVVVLEVPDIDEYTKKATEAGGKVVMEKRDVGEYGIYARIQDTEGNVIGLWQTKMKKE